jgi:hypothetical protein
MSADSVWLGDRHQGFQDTRKQGSKGIAELPPACSAPHGVLSDVAGGTLRGPPA